jgi:hypothetical protein
MIPEFARICKRGAGDILSDNCEPLSYTPRLTNSAGWVTITEHLATRQFEIRTRIHTGFTDQHG